MANPEEYKAGFLGKTSRKLSILTDKDGKTERDETGKIMSASINAARALSQELSKYGSYVGVALRGSSVLGYKTNPSDPEAQSIGDVSDIDIDVLYVKPDRISGEYGAVVNAADSFAGRYKDTTGQKIHILPTDVSENALRNEIKVRHTNFAEGFAGLCELAIGKNANKSLEEARESAEGIIASLPEAEKKEMLERIIDTLVHREELALGKIHRRVNDQNGSWDREEFITNRKKLWEKRVHAIFKK